MRNLFMVAISSIVFASAAWAADVSCDAQASKLNLLGAAQSNFAKKCEMTAKSAATSCEGQAATKKLAGAERNSFIRKCYEGNQVIVPSNIYCETEADARKLTADARKNLVKKCLKDPKSIEQKPVEKIAAEKKPEAKSTPKKKPVENKSKQ